MKKPMVSKKKNTIKKKIVRAKETKKSSFFIPSSILSFYSPQKQVLTMRIAQGNRLTLVATAHVSKKSVRLVEDSIAALQPNAVAVELDARRLKTLEGQNFRDLDIVKIIKEGQGYFFLAFLLLSIYQKKMAERTGSDPGAEMKAAVMLAKKQSLPLLLIDRPLDVTLKRIFSAVGFFKRIGFLVSLIGFEAPNAAKELGEGKTGKDAKKGKVGKVGKKIFEKEGAELEEELQAVMEEEALLSMRKEIRNNMPEIAGVLLDERDRYMAKELQAFFKGKTNTHVLAVVGAAHGRGIIDGMMGNFFVEKSQQELLQVGKSSKIFKRLALIVPAVVLGLVGYGFYLGDYAAVGKGIWWWILFNGAFSALGAVAALAHPLTIVVAFLAAPFTSLNPAIGVGMITGLVEVFLRPPRIKDFDAAKVQLSAFKSWWSNRLTRVLLVFFLTNLGSAIGTWVALPLLANLFL